MSFFRAPLGILLCITSISMASIVTNKPVQDATITEKTPDTADGTGVVITSGTCGSACGVLSSRALLKFNLSNSIPSNAVITSAALTVKVVNAGATSSTFDLRKLLRDWNESSTWNTRLAPSTLWTVSGASAPVDFSSVITQTNFIPGVGTYTFASNSNMVADVQEWVNNPTNNFGWIVISESQGTGQTERKFSSREDSANAPTLVVQFSIPATPPQLLLLPHAGNQFQFSFQTESNRSYTVEYCSSLIATNWGALTNISSTPAEVTIVVSDILVVGNRFYRVNTF